MTAECRRSALRAIKKAIKLRQHAGIASDQPCNVYDLAEGLNVEVRFANLPSVEGVYSPGKPTIIVSSLRPPGRQAFTCAHELGHHLYGHGEQFDEIVEERATSRTHDPKEFEADCFASALLITKTSVMKALAVRGFSPKTLSADQVYWIASWLGVGYTTLVSNMNWGLDLLTKDQAEALLKIRLPQIRHSILGYECKDHLVVVDEAWTNVAIDVQVGDVVVLPSSVVVEGNVVSKFGHNSTQIIVRAEQPGVGRVSVAPSNWANFIRVSRKQFSGLARFRHLEETDDE